jgi:hypothetical protein
MLFSNENLNASILFKAANVLPHPLMLQRKLIACQYRIFAVVCAS